MTTPKSGGGWRENLTLTLAIIVTLIELVQLIM